MFLHFLGTSQHPRFGSCVFQKRREVVRYLFLARKIPYRFFLVPDKNGRYLHLYISSLAVGRNSPKLGEESLHLPSKPKTTRVVSCFFCWLHLRGPRFPVVKVIFHTPGTPYIHRFRWIPGIRVFHLGIDLLGPRESNRFFLGGAAILMGILAGPPPKLPP